MKSDRKAPVAIIGGGFSGTMLAAQLARRGIVPLLIEGTERVGRGTAFSTDEAAHLLNVRAEGMSAWPENPDHFAERFEKEGGDRRGFAERRLYGRYLREILDASGAETVAASALSASPNGQGWTLELSDGSTVETSALALANGNQAPELLAVAAGAGPRFINNPWGADAKAAVQSVVETGGDVLLLGTGLTMVDMVLSLSSAGHQGAILALSRRGLIPRAHADFTPAPVKAHEPPHGEVRSLWRWLRRRGGEVGWRAAVDSLRPHSHALWKSLDRDQQRRFLRHARPWWDVHRHRIAPEVAQQIHDMVAAGQLEIAAGRVGSMIEEGDCLAVTMRRRRREKLEQMRFAFAFNCTGPLGSIERTRDPLLKGLLDGGRIRPDHLGMGIEVDERSRAAGTTRLWALGPLTKGRYWEIVAVPDIRGQADQVADDIVAMLDARI